ncbi:MAG: DUF3343 domain-containing protein [Clostridiales bacterium]|nr:DUF3343 domain-containing protein [Clostridiales bacterium]
MKYLIVAFTSRNNLLQFAKILRYNGIPATVINTPRCISISCGLSIKTDLGYYEHISTLLRSTNLGGFLGVFLIERQGMSESAKRLK